MLALIYRCFLVVHIMAGTFAVIAGLLALVVPKPVVREGPTHRRRGRWFTRAMLVVIGTALVMTVLRFNPYFAGLTASAALTTFSGVRVLRRKRPDLDPAQRATALDWSVTLACALVSAALAFMVMTGRVTRNVPVVQALAFGTLVYAAYDLWRFARPASFPCTPNLWLYEHIVKMLGSYFGAVAAFSGSVLVLFPPPWRQLWATSTGQLLAIALVVRWYLIMKRQRLPRVADAVA